MKVLCTAPCFPACQNEANGTLLNAKSKAVLGWNCTDHFRRLVKDDYELAPMPEHPKITYEKLSSDEFMFAFRPKLDGIETVLTQVSTGKTKVFFNAGHTLTVIGGLLNHMNSLTDDLCAQWFNVREKPAKKKPKE